MLNDIQCIIILGGKSSRFVDESSDPKPNYLIHGKTWLQWQLNFVSQLGLRDIVLVLGYHYESVLERHSFLKLNELVSFGDLRVLSILNEEPSRGPFSSLQLGIRYSTTQRVLYFPIDVPTLDYATFKNLLSVTAQYDVIKCCYDDKGGHPLLIQGQFLQQLKNDMRADLQLNQLIRNLDPHLICRLAVNSSNVLLNLNKPHDLDQYVKSNSIRFSGLNKGFSQN